MLIYKHEEGDIVRPGIGYAWNPLFELFLGIPTGHGRLAWIGSTIKRGLKGIRISLDFFRDHAMFRPNDVDSWGYLECRRCGQTTGDRISQYCGGFWLHKRSGSPWEVRR